MAFCLQQLMSSTEEATLQAGDVLYVSLGCIRKSSMRKRPQVLHSSETARICVM